MSKPKYATTRWTNRHPWKTRRPAVPNAEAAKLDDELRQRAEQAEAEALVGYVPRREV